MKTTFLSVLALMLLLSACKYSSTKKKEFVLYSKEGWSFSLPKYWKVKKDRPIEGVPNSRFISASDDEPFSKDAYLIITAIDSVSVEKNLENLIIQSRASYHKRKIEFGMLNQPKEIMVGKQKVLRADFETKVITNRNKGSFLFSIGRAKPFHLYSVLMLKIKRRISMWLIR
ncbi:hypothetical protein ASE92_14795 [Pedobacter sp. Leaf41]|uniref:hypothetical protein n=1 Tax=Pedobacter sp. Leaf41 TaxID=1736218 RepID=UPI000702FCBA|nr:hypothetical protein [Pedobacter sp. Leaf41]KQN33911.1 hypothetical protein ASE92_14795 [Pedobacter sp. Leaf41]